MKNLIQFATRIDKDLKEKVMEFSKEKNVSVQKIVEFSLKKTLSNPDNNKSSITIFANEQLEKASDKVNWSARELVSELEYLLNESKVEIPEEIKEKIEEHDRLMIEEGTLVDLYNESLWY